MPKTPATSLDLSITLDPARVETLQAAFPELDVADTAKKLALIATTELLDMLAGKRRYLSLSHQYIEWIQQIYETLLPGEEFTYRRLYDRFRFPPGPAAYIARVLRDRQSTSLFDKAKAELGKKLKAELALWQKVPTGERSAASLRSLTLTAREYDLLQAVVDKLLNAAVAIEYASVTSRGREHVVVTYSTEYINKVLPEIDNL
jgi:hypothetical protein